MRFQKIIWSPVEEDYLRANRNNMSLQQLSIALAKSNAAVKRKLAEFDGKPQPKKLSKRSVIGKRPDLDNMFFRSGWEANVARWLKSQGKPFMFEPKVFMFEGVKHGTMSYCPDFFLYEEGWLEIKGFLDGKSKTQIRRFKKQYPEEFKKLKVIIASPGVKAAKFFKDMGVPVLAYYNDLNKQCRDSIPNWE